MKKRQNKFSYKFIVRRKNKNGKFYYVEKIGSKEKITSREEWENLQHTKQELKKVYKKGSKQKLNEYRKEIREIESKQKKADAKNKKHQNLERDVQYVWGNSGASQLEDFYLMTGKLNISFNEVLAEETEIRTKQNLQFQKKADAQTKKLKRPINKKVFSVYKKINQSNPVKITDSNLLEARMFVSEIADEFYNRWQELKGTKEQPNSPQLKFAFIIYENGQIELDLSKTMFSFEQINFFNITKRLYKNYFGK